MKAPGPNCPALLIWKPRDVKEVACVDQGCCRWEQHKAEVGVSVAPCWLCNVQRAPELCTAGLVRMALSSHSSPPKPLQRTGCLLVPPGFWLYSTEHILCLCALLLPWSGHSVRLGRVFGKNCPDQE